MNKKINIQIFSNFIIPIIGITIVQGVDYLYFEYLHQGLKFPDYFPIMFLTIFVIWKFLLKNDFKDLIGIDFNNWKIIKDSFLKGFKYGLSVVVIALLAGLLTSELKIVFNVEYLKNMSYMVFGYLIFIPVSAFYEELHYRGLYLKSFNNKYLKHFLVIISSIMFSCVHISLINNYSVYYPINIMLIGIILSLLSIRTNNLIICTGFHSAWNFILIILSPIFNDYSERYVEFSYITTIILLFVVLYEIYKYFFLDCGILHYIFGQEKTS